MSLERIQNTSLWKNSLKDFENDPNASQKERLRVSLRLFRDNVSTLVSKISHALPGLTQHDITHLDALWETASLIAGDDYPLNPLEGFILGGAILLHDSALCFDAYDNGIEGIRSTNIWKDTFAMLKENANNSQTESDLEDEADFITLRNLHANQAAKLLGMSWTDPDTDAPLYLLNDTALRKHLGTIIGEIAASHHWDIEEVVSRFSNQVNTPAEFPRDWRIDPLKIACLLRCADAAHINNERAPDFLHALLKRNGISFNHWQAQNRLSNADIDQVDDSTLLYTSTRPFLEEESESWWVAYDAICLVDKEIKSCNAILDRGNNNTLFQVKRVKGTEAPEIMTRFITVENWIPKTNQIHVSNLEKLIKNLGGDKLYGESNDLLGVVLRELIQNSRDAIKAREKIESEFSGEINIKITPEDDNYLIIIEDNGVGMSERVLTGSLLDFGASFWSSSLVNSEFPGLRSSGFKSIGQFGIGFYSIFMIADNVQVLTKEYHEGLQNTKQLLFKNGLTLRPLFKNGAPENFNTSVSTQVKFKLQSDYILPDYMIEIKTNNKDIKNFKVDIEDYIASLCAGLDTNIYIRKNDSDKRQIHTDIYGQSFNYQKWLETISFANYQSDERVKQYISNNYQRIEPIVEEDKILGLAAISTEIVETNSFLSIRTIGGLGNTVHYRNASPFIGFIDYLPNSAKRDSSNKYAASDDTMRYWAMKQLEKLEQESLDNHEKYIAAHNLCNFNVDPTSIASILISMDTQHHFVSFDELAKIATKMPIGFLSSTLIDGHMETHTSIKHVNGFALILPLRAGNFLSLKMENEEPVENNSIIDCLHRTLKIKGYTPKWNITKNIAKSNLGYDMDILYVTLNKE